MINVKNVFSLFLIGLFFFALGTFSQTVSASEGFSGDEVTEIVLEPEEEREIVLEEIGLLKEEIKEERIARAQPAEISLKSAFGSTKKVEPEVEAGQVPVDEEVDGNVPPSSSTKKSYKGVTDKGHFQVLLGPNFSIKNAAGTRFDVGMEVGSTACFYFNAFIGGGSTLLQLGPKFNIMIQPSDSLPLYFYPSIALGPAIGFTGGVKTITGFVRPAFGVSFLLNDRWLFTFEPFVMNMYFGGYSTGGVGGYQLTQILYSLNFGLGIAW